MSIRPVSHGAHPRALNAAAAEESAKEAAAEEEKKPEESAEANKDTTQISAGTEGEGGGNAVYEIPDEPAPAPVRSSFNIRPDYELVISMMIAKSNSKIAQELNRTWAMYNEEIAKMNREADKLASQQRADDKARERHAQPTSNFQKKA